MNSGGNKNGTAQDGAHVVVVGAGGNIGSHLVPLLGRMNEVGRLTLIDPDVYEKSNLQSQDVTTADLGKPKVLVQAHRLRSLAPDLPVNALVAAVEDVPWGQLRGDVILTGLDTRRTRQAVNRRARWLGVPWLDAGVEAGSGLARVSCYGPGNDQPCLECAWNGQDYLLLEQPYSCDGTPLATPASGAPARLGALAAAWQAIECHRLLTAVPDESHWGRQWVITPEGAEVFTSTLCFNPECRLPRHRPWRIRLLATGPGETSLEDAYRLAGAEIGDLETIRLGVPDQTFVTRSGCAVCNAQRVSCQLETSLRQSPAYCAACERNVRFHRLDMEESLLYSDLDQARRDQPLADFGLRPGEVFCLSGEFQERYYQLPLPSKPAACRPSGRSEGVDHEA